MRFLLGWALLILGPVLFSQDFQSQVKIFWPENLLVIVVETPLLPGQVLPIRRLQTENLVKENLPSIVFSAVSPIIVDNEGTIAQYTLRKSELYAYFSGLSGAVIQDFSRTSNDFSKLSVRYSLELTKLAAPFIRHDINVVISPTLGYQNSADFTGLVIYARGELPVHGERTTSTLQPSLFPRLLDENTDVILSREALSPEILRKQSMVVYTQDLAEPPFRDRIGSRPLRIAAKALFGTLRTDIIILNSDADMIRSVESGRQVLAQGRILIIVDPE